MQKQKPKSWTRKIAAFMLAIVCASTISSILISATMPTATVYADAGDYLGAEEKDTNGNCPSGYTPVVDGGCSKNATICPGTKAADEKYYHGSDSSACKSADALEKAVDNNLGQETLQKFLAIILAIEKTINKLLWPILTIIGGLINNDILFSSGMSERLYDIWVPIRNIVNILFVLALVGLALYNILGINSENSQYSIKAMLPKLIAGIIVVNFSFLGMKVFLDGINVLTTAIFAIPNQVSQGLAPGSNAGTILNNSDDSVSTNAREHFCKQLYSENGSNLKPEDFSNNVDNLIYMRLGDKYHIPARDVKKIKAYIPDLKADVQNAFNADLNILRQAGAYCKFDGQKLILSDSGLAFFNQYGANNAALAMAISMGKMLFVQDISSNLSKNTYESFAINTIFSLLLYIVYATSFIVLFAVLVARLIIMWLGIAFSPIIALGIVVPVVKEKFKTGELTTKFVEHAIAPIIIGMTMTVGWIMLNALQNTLGSDTSSLLSAKDALIPGVPIPGLETLQGLLVCLATVAVVWVGVFAGAEKTIANKFTNVIKEQLERAGKFVAKAPFKYTPWIPVQIQGKEGTGKFSLNQVLRAKDNLINSIENPENINKLSDALGITRGADEKTLTSLSSADDIASTFGRIQDPGKISGKNGKAILEKFKEGTDAYRNLVETSRDSSNLEKKRFADKMLEAIAAVKAGREPTADQARELIKFAKEANKAQASTEPSAGKEATPRKDAAKQTKYKDFKEAADKDTGYKTFLAGAAATAENYTQYQNAESYISKTLATDSDTNFTSNLSNLSASLIRDGKMTKDQVKAMVTAETKRLQEEAIKGKEGSTKKAALETRKRQIEKAINDYNSSAK